MKFQTILKVPLICIWRRNITYHVLELWLMNTFKHDLRNAQWIMLKKWQEEYEPNFQNLGIALTDTINMDAFLSDFDLRLSELYTGCRHDSGDPIIWGVKLLEHYKRLGIDPNTKTAVFSDGLNITRAIEIATFFKDKLNVTFGIGTNLTNDVGLKPLSIVVKMTRVNEIPVAKISDQPSKTICINPDFLMELKKAYQIS